MREAEVSIAPSGYEALGIEELVELCQEANQFGIRELACHGDGAIIEVEVGRRIDEERLDGLDYVDRWERVTETDSGHLYVVGFRAPTLSDDITEYADDLIGTCDPDVHDSGATLSLVGPQETIRGTINEYLESGISPELRKLGEYEGRNRPMEQLTNRQLDVIEVAYESGYYDVPREASTADVAAEVGIDPSTVAEHLQRAERNLLTQHLSSETG